MTKSLWQPPRLRVSEDADEERRATWLELFFDLVFVVAVAELGHTLSESVSVESWLKFAALFAPVWWCWVGATFYATRFDTDDLSHRLLTLLQMAIAAVMAVNIHYAFGKTAVGFALAYVAFRLVLILQYVNAAYHIPIARPLAGWYIRGFGLSALCWAISIVVPAPWRYYLWVLGMVIEFLTPLLAGDRMRTVPPDATHVPERLGLFIIIVLGESIWAVVRGMTGQTWSALAVLIAFLGMGTAFSLWWIYFDTLDNSPLIRVRRGDIYVAMLWLYAHLPLAIGLVGAGVSVEHIVKNAEKVLPASDRWLLCGSVALCLLALATIHWISCSLGARRKILSVYRLIAALALLGIALIGASFSTLTILIWAAIACVSQVMVELSGSWHAASVEK